MEITNSDIRAIGKAVRHLDKVFEAMPSLPYDCPTRAYNAYRLLRREDLPKLKRKLEKWQNTSTGAQATERR